MEGSFFVDAEEIAEDIKRIASESISEEDLKQGVEYILKSKVLEKLKIPWAPWRPPKARYEVTLVSGVRVDALYGHVIIEYERPKTFETKSGFEKAVEQVKKYIRDHAQIEARIPRYFGVVLDGYKIGFVRYREALKGFESKGPFEINKNTIARFIEAIIGLRRKALSPDELLKDFGPESQIAREAIKALYNKLLKTTPRTKMLFEDWRRVFSQVCAYDSKKLKGLEKMYGFKKGEADVEKLLFALHTYYALIMKLLAAEVASLYVAPKLWSYLRALEDAYYRGHEKLRDELRELEEGGIFAKLGIINFLEADYFAWYLDEWDEQLAQKITNIIKKLSDYDPSAAELEPEKVRDLFKRLYQNLVPKKIRHDLGEYYTPDWLAELVLDEVGWTLETFEKKAEEKNNPLAPLELRLLDPACGSGTFLVLAISRLREYIEEHWIDKGAALRRIVKNVVGFDLNPLAVIASRANYLIALGDLLRERGAEPIEIPVYLADSILVERRSTLTGLTYVLRTAVGEFAVPTSIVKKGLLAKTLSILEECVREEYKSNEFKARLLREVSLEKAETSIIIKLFEILLKLEKEGKNRIWMRVLKNSFAPFFVGKFDYVVGNPPWVAWENLPNGYRELLRELFKYYNILPSHSLAAAKMDISMLFVYRCMDRYLVEGGLFGFLITQTVFKSIAGEGFRRFSIKGTPINILKVHDMVTLKPFEGAQNRTSIFIAMKGSNLIIPVLYIVWKKRIKGEIDTTLPLKEVLGLTDRVEMWAEPIGGGNSPWMVLPKKETLTKVRGIIARSAYTAHSGVDCGRNSIYWVRIKGKSANFVIIENFHETGRKKVKREVTEVEPELVYPLVRGRQVKKWCIETESSEEKPYVLIPHDVSGEVIPEFKLKTEYPKAYAYFSKFRRELENRSSYKLMGKKQPFYAVFKIGNYTFAPYKVVWREQAKEPIAAVIGDVEDEYLGKRTIIPDHKLMLVGCWNEDEAYYLCAILNSLLVKLIAKGYMVETQISTHLLKYIRVLGYNSKDSVHTRLAELAKKAHLLASQNDEINLIKVEEEIDKLVAQLYGLTEEELKEIKRSLAILEGREFEEEEAEEMPVLEPDVTLADPVVEEGKPCDVEIVVSNPLDKEISNVKVKVQLLDKKVEQLFDKVEKEEKFKVRLDGLKKGKYKVKLVMEYIMEGSSKRVEKELTLYVKERKSRRVVERVGIDELFGD